MFLLKILKVVHIEGRNRIKLTKIIIDLHIHDIDRGLGEVSDFLSRGGVSNGMIEDYYVRGLPPVLSPSLKPHLAVYYLNLTLVKNLD